MNKSNKTETEESLIEQLVKAIVEAYKQGFNQQNKQYEIDFTITLSAHKVPTPEGNKEAAYLRLERHIREKGDWPKKVTTEDGKEIEDEGWSSKLIHHEPYFFKNLTERLTNQKWKEQLFMNLVVRLTSAGIEYAELLSRLKQSEVKQKAEEIPKDETEQRLNNIGLVGAKEQPAPLTEGDKKYKEWLAKERATEGIV